MSFVLKPVILDCPTLAEFFTRWEPGMEDLLVTTEAILSNAFGQNQAPCDVLCQEFFGRGEPTEELVDRMLTAIRGRTYNRIIAIGGGAVIDIAKLLVFGGVYTCAQLFEHAPSLPKKRVLIAVPTTCGTGSEVTNIASVEFPKLKSKVGIAAQALFPDAAVLIPEALKTLPYDVFAYSSIDALIHAVESYLSPKANDFTRALGERAIRMILRGYRKQIDEGRLDTLPSDLSSFLTASTLAGAAFGNAGVGAVHALAYPVGGDFHVPHGLANYLMFREVFMEYRGANAEMGELEHVLAGALACGLAEVWDRLFELLECVKARPGLKEFGANEGGALRMAESVVANQQRLLVNNPVPLSTEQIANIYIRSL